MQTRAIVVVRALVFGTSAVSALEECSHVTACGCPFPFDGSSGTGVNGQPALARAGSAGCTADELDAGCVNLSPSAGPLLPPDLPMT